MVARTKEATRNLSLPLRVKQRPLKRRNVRLGSWVGPRNQLHEPDFLVVVEHLLDVGVCGGDIDGDVVDAPGPSRLQPLYQPENLDPTFRES